MENKLFLNRYRLSLGWNGLPVELHRTPTTIMYRGQEWESGRELAIELVPWRSTDPVARKQLEAEATAAKQISHINIPKLYDFGIEDGQLIYVTEYFEGHTAEAWVAARGPLPTAAVLRAAVQIADALRAASFHRLSHRALCPANIVFEPNETALGEWPAIKVLHWLGLPTNFAEAGEGDARLATASRFASPEQRRGEKADFPSATYSLGRSIWFLLTGALPAAPVPAIEGTPAAPNEVEKLRGVPKIVRHLLGRMLRLNPAERPQDPVALSAFLQTCLARVERREAMNRRLRFRVGARPRVVEAGTARKRPTKAQAVAAVLLVCAALAAIAMPRYFHARTSAQASIPAKEVSRSDNALEVSAARTLKSAPAQQSKAMLPAVAANPPRTELPRNQISAGPTPLGQGHAQVMVVTNTPVPKPPPGQTNAAAITADSTTRRKMTHTVIAAEAAPSEEGPEVVAESPSTIRREGVPEKETPAGRAQTEPPKETVAKSFEAPVSVAAFEPSPTADPVENIAPVVSDGSASEFTTEPKKEASKAAGKISHPKKSATRLVATKSTSRKKKAKKPTEVAYTSVRKRSRITHTARRAQKLPLLHVGAARAELVGTTDGKWILAVSPSHRQIIVWPPPGFR